MAARRLSFRQQLLHRTSRMELDGGPPSNPEEPGGEGATKLEDLTEDCLGLILDQLDPITVSTLEKTGKRIHHLIQRYQYWRRAVLKLILRHPYLSDQITPHIQYIQAADCELTTVENCKTIYNNIAKRLNTFWRKSEQFKPKTKRNGGYFCKRAENEKIVSIKVTGDYFVTVLGPRTRSDPAVFSIRVFNRETEEMVTEISDLVDKPEYLVLSPKYNLLVAKAHSPSRGVPDSLQIWSLVTEPLQGEGEGARDPLLRSYHLKASGMAARCTALTLKEDIFFGSSRKDCVLMCPTRYNNKSVVRFLALKRVSFSCESFPGAWRVSEEGTSTSGGPKFVKTNNGDIWEGKNVAIEEVGRVHIPHLVQLGVADFTEKWAILFSEAPKELPDRNIHLIVIDLGAMAIRHILKAYEPRIAVYGASLHPQEPDVAVAVGKDGYLKVFEMDSGRELTNQRVPKPMARTNTTIIDFFGTTRFMLGSITDIHVFDLQFPLYASPEAKLDRMERRREHIRTVSIYGEVGDMVEERALQLAPPPGVQDLDPLLQLQQNLAALNQVNQAIEANIVRPELPEEADRVEQLMVEFRAVQQRIHDLNQEMESRISVAIEAVAADLRHIFVLTNTGDIMTFDFGESSTL